MNSKNKLIVTPLIFALFAVLSGASFADNVEDIRYRVQKVGKLNIGDAAAAAPAAADSAAAPATTDGGAAATETATAASNPADLYQSSCFACHGTGAAGAPILGDKAIWADRIAQGEETLLDHAINGFNAMPPRGGASLDDEQMKQVVSFMIQESQ